MVLKFFKKLLKRFAILIAAILASCLLVFSVTMANLFLTGKVFHEKKYNKAEVAIKKVDEVEKKVRDNFAKAFEQSLGEEKETDEDED